MTKLFFLLLYSCQNKVLFFCSPDPYKEGVGVHGPKGEKPPEAYKKIFDPEAPKFGFETLWEIQSVRNYCLANKGLVLQEVS
jgi:hypothetical protein